MDFFNKVKLKLRTRYLLLAVLLLLIACWMGWFTISLGFSSDTDYQIGFRGINGGIPLPNWLISGISVVLCLGSLAGGAGCIKETVKMESYNQLTASVAKIGNLNTLGDMLSAIKKSKLTNRGDLRYSKQIVFYFKGTTVSAISPTSIIKIQPEVYKGKRDEYFVCIYYAGGTIKIKTNKKKGLLLVEDMQRVLFGGYINQERSTDAGMTLTVKSNGKTTAFHQNTVRVGRDEKYCDLCIAGETAISRTHVTFTYVDNSWVVTDHSSVNGTWINGEKLEPGKMYNLNVNDQIDLAHRETLIFNQNNIG